MLSTFSNPTFAAAKHIDHVDPKWRVLRAGVAGFTQHFGVARVHRRGVVAALLLVLGSEKTRAVQLGRQAHNGDRVTAAKGAARGRDVVGHGRGDLPADLTRKRRSKRPLFAH
jgi:hypothetical protein